MKKIIICTIYILLVTFNLQAIAQDEETKQSKEKEMVLEKTENQNNKKISPEMEDLYESLNIKRQKHIEKMKEKENQKK